MSFCFVRNFGVPAICRKRSLFLRQSLLCHRWYCDAAFWDEGGSVEVKRSSAPSLAVAAAAAVSARVAAQRQSDVDVVRLTKFGHVRLDSDNVATEQVQRDAEIGRENLVRGSEPTFVKSEESANYIEECFFREYKPSTWIAREYTPPSKPLQAGKVSAPDLNIVDSQYFQPSPAEPDTKYTKDFAASSQSVTFEGNEIDSQYFGTPQRETSGPVQARKETGPVSARDYLRKLKEPAESSETYGSHKYTAFLPELTKLPTEVIISMLKKSIIYNQGGIIALSKPYGMVTTDVDGKSGCVLTDYLPALAQRLGVDKLRTVHRLDRDTTGVLLLASNEETARSLSQMLEARCLRKEYLAITRGVPELKEGTIDIPIGVSVLLGRQRMKLRPVQGSTPAAKTFRAITHYKVLDCSGSACLMRLHPETGIRHQLRVHLSQAINCPVLGDHKYSHEGRFAPQKLGQDLLTRLELKQAKVRNVPMHLHASSVTIPAASADVVIRAPLPNFFVYTVRKLRLKLPANNQK